MISEINNATLRTIGFKLKSACLSKEDKVALSNIIILNIMRLNLTTIQQFDLSAVKPKTLPLISERIYDIEGILASLPTPTENPVYVSIAPETIQLIIDASELSEEYKKYILKNFENKLDPKAMLTECEEIKNYISELQKEIQKLNKINNSKSSRGI